MTDDANVLALPCFFARPGTNQSHTQADTEGPSLGIWREGSSDARKDATLGVPYSLAAEQGVLGYRSLTACTLTSTEVSPLPAVFDKGRSRAALAKNSQ